MIRGVVARMGARLVCSVRGRGIARESVSRSGRKRGKHIANPATYSNFRYSGSILKSEHGKLSAYLADLHKKGYDTTTREDLFHVNIYYRYAEGWKKL